MKIYNLSFADKRNTILRIIIGLHILIFYVSLIQAQTVLIPDGYAGYKGTTGGGNSAPDTVSSIAEFKGAVEDNDPAVIIVNGRFDMGGNISIGSNKTIIGANSSSGLYGGSVGLTGTNYIIQNLTLGPSGGDVMEASGATKVFVTKCSFHDSGDELFSIVREADFVTVSWCKFYFDNPDSHSFASLIGNSDGRTSDRGKLHVTMHHNWYAENVVERMPRVRFGHVHIYNNYYNSVGNNYCIGTGVECHIRLENTFFDNVNQLWFDWNGVSSGGVMGWHNLKLINAETPTYFTNTYPVFDLPYNYILDPVDSVKTIVTSGAGNVFGAVDNNQIIQVSITSPEDNDIYEVNSSITINADAAISKGIIDSIEFYHDKVLIGVSKSEPYTISWENVEAGNYRIIAKAIDNEGISAISDIVNITVEEESTGIKQENSGSDLVLFPNPVSNDLLIHLRSNDPGSTYFTLYNMEGEIIERNIFSGYQHTLHMEEFPSGMYFITVKSKDYSRTEKIIKL